MELHYDENYDQLDELHKRDALIKMLRDIEGESKLGMIKLMAQTKHNSRYNHKLLPTYLMLREKYDKYVKEHQVTIEHLEKIITHLDNILIDFMKTRGNKSHNKGKYKTNKESCSKDTDIFISNILKEKQKISKMLIKMRNVLNKLTAIDSNVDITPNSLSRLNVNDININDDDDYNDYSDSDSRYNGDNIGNPDNLIDSIIDYHDENEDEDEDDYHENHGFENDDDDDDDDDDGEDDEDEDDEDDEDEDDEDEDDDEDEHPNVKNIQQDNILYYIGDADHITKNE